MLGLLKHRSNHVVGPVAELVGAWEIESALPELEESYNRFLVNSIKTDPGCVAKRAIVEAMTKLGSSNSELFLEAVSYIQLDPMWGPPEDTAAGIRGLAGRGLFSMHFPGAMSVHVDLIHDPKIETRRIAIDSLAEIGTNECELILRTLANCPERPFNKDDPDTYSVMPECLLALMKINTERSIDFVVRFLHGIPEHMESAALAIGESRHPDAYNVLRKRYEELEDEESKGALCLPIALTRTEEAFESLCQVMENEPVPIALFALEALGLYSADSDCLDRIHRHVMQRKEDRLIGQFYTQFSGEND